MLCLRTYNSRLFKWTSDIQCYSCFMEGHAESKIQLIRRHIHAFPDFPKKGILFRDIGPILKDPSALTAVIDLFEEHVKNENWEVDLIVGLDARGFLFGPLLAQRLGVGFVMVRKKGKLPGATVCVAYDLEYGKAEAEIQEDAVTPGQKVVLLDDLLATGGTLFAACELMKKQDAEIQGCMVVIELTELKARSRRRRQAQLKEHDPVWGTDHTDPHRSQGLENRCQPKKKTWKRGRKMASDALAVCVVALFC